MLNQKPTWSRGCVVDIVVVAVFVVAGVVVDVIVDVDDGCGGYGV